LHLRLHVAAVISVGDVRLSWGLISYTIIAKGAAQETWGGNSPTKELAVSHVSDCSTFRL